MKVLHVSAGGKGERISAYISSFRPQLPKHLLPVPREGGTLLGEIARNAQRSFEEVDIWSSKDTYPQISLTLASPATVKIKVDSRMTGPLGPMVRSLIQSGARTFGCAGDFYCDFSWSEFERFHDSHGRPISILVAKSVPAPKGARFYLSEEKVARWERVDKTTRDDLINIGCYIIDPDPAVMLALGSMIEHKEDDFFDALIPKGLVAGFDPGVQGFNVNVAVVYESLLHALGESSHH